MASIYSYNKEVYPSQLYNEIEIGLGFYPSFLNYDVVTFDIDVYFDTPLTGGEETTLTTIVNNHVFVDLSNSASYYSVDTTLLDASDITTNTLLSATINATNTTSTNLTVTNFTGGTIFSGGTNLTNIFSPIVHTHQVSAITDIETYYLPRTEDFVENVILVGKSGNVDYTSIKSAMDSITGNSSTNRFIIRVSPGIYVEDTITFKTYTSIVGESYNTTIIEVDATSKDVIIGADQATLNNVTVRGATDSGKCGIYYSSSTGNAFAFFSVENVRLGANNILAKSVGTGGQSCSIQFSNVKYGGSGDTFNTGFWATYDGVSGFSTIQLRSFTTTNGAISSPVSTFALADGPSCQIVGNSGQVNKAGTTEGTAFKAINGGSVRLTSVNIRNWGIGIEMPNSGSSTTVSAVGMNFENNTQDINVSHPTASGKIDSAQLSKSMIDPQSSVYVIGSDVKRIIVNKLGGDFNSIKDAVDYITDSSETNRYLIEVGPGVFQEDEIDTSTKPFISIKGSSIQTTLVVPNTNTQHIFNIGYNNEISFLTLSGASAGYAGIYCYDIGDFGQAHKLSFYDCDTNVHVESVTQDTIFYGEYLDFNGEYSYGIKVVANNSFLSEANVENYYQFPTGVSTQINNYATGSGATLNILSAGIYGNGVSGTTGVYIQDNAKLTMTSTIVDGLYYGLHDGNVGGGTDFQLFGVTIINSEVYDVFADNPSTVGILQGVFSHTKINNNNNNISWIFLDKDDGEIDITKSLAVTFDDGTHTDLSTLLFESATMGLLSGGDITNVSGLTINVSSGYGYVSKLNDATTIKRLDWGGQDLTLASGSTLYIFLNENGVLQSGGKPNTTNNIVLGRVITKDEVEIIDKSALKAEHSSNRYSDLFTEGLGPLYANGTVVTENATPFKLDITQGEYYYGTNKFLPTGGTQVFFTEYYRNGLSDWTVTTGTTTVNNTQYDNGGTLTALTTSYYTKHILYTVGEGDYERYLLIYGQNEYATLVEAEGASLPTPPSYFSNGVVQVAAIYIQQGDANIIQIEDIKPTVAFRAGGVNASSVHGNLIGLDSDDHIIYLLADGTRAMSGTLNMGNNSIISASTVNGVTVQTHASRHLPNGADPLTTGVPSTINHVNQEGIQNAFARQDHIHAHGNLTGGTTHDAVTTSVNGFMSATDKVYLDSVPTLLNQKAFLSGATFTGTITAPTISGTTYQGNVITSGTSVGGGVDVFKQVNGNNLEIKSLVAGTNITLTPGTNTITIASSGGVGSSRITGTTATTDATLTTLDTIDTLNDNSTNIVEVYVKAYQSGGTQWGVWKRTLTVTKVSGTVTIREENADVDKQSTGLRASSLSFAVSSGDILVQVTGIAATTITWNSAYEIIL